MGKREVTILDPATDAVAEVAYFIESKGMPDTAKKFVDQAFNFLPALLMTELNIIHPQIQYGKDCITAA